MKLSLCLTTYNRDTLLVEAFEKILPDKRISEIIIVDDCSSPGYYEFLQQKVAPMSIKIKIYRNAENVGMQRNKERAIRYATNTWCILFDSDNIIDTSYIDALKEYHQFDDSDSNIIYCPSWARPNFDYRKYERLLYTRQAAAKRIREDEFNMLMNTCNYVVNREAYLAAFKYDQRHVCSDTIWFNYNWLLNGGKFFVVPDMHYFHRVHEGSGFLQNADYNMLNAEYVRKLISQLK